MSVVESGRIWYDRPLRIVQTVLRQPDAAVYDAAEAIDYVKRLNGNVLVVNGGGLHAFYPSEVPGHHRVDGLKGDMLEDLCQRAHEAATTTCFCATRIGSATTRMALRSLLPACTRLRRSARSATKDTASPSSGNCSSATTSTASGRTHPRSVSSHMASTSRPRSAATPAWSCLAAPITKTRHTGHGCAGATPAFCSTPRPCAN